MEHDDECADQIRFGGCCRHYCPTGEHMDENDTLAIADEVDIITTISRADLKEALMLASYGLEDHQDDELAVRLYSVLERL